MDQYEKRLTNSLITWVFGLIVGVLFGLIVLGWWLWPVQWVDASPDDLLYQYQVEYLNTVIEAYGYTGDAATAQARYFALGENAETALAQIVQDPGNLPPLLLSDFSEQVAGVPIETLAGQPVETPDTTTGLNPWMAIIIALFFIAVGAVVTYLIFRGKERQEGEIEYVEYEETAYEEAPDEQAAPAEIAYELPEEEEIPQPVESGETPGESRFEEWQPMQAESEGTLAAETKELDLPPFIAAAGAGVAAGLVAAELTDEEQVQEETIEAVSPEEEAPDADEPAGQDAGISAEGMAMAGLATTWLAETEEEAEPEPVPEDLAEEEPFEEPFEEEIEAPEFVDFEDEAEAEADSSDLVEDFAEVEAVEQGEELVKPLDPIEVKMRKKLEFVEGIGPAYSQKLSEAGIHTTGKLMVEGVTRTGRQELAEKTGISEHLILKWLNEIDLYRIKGIGSEFADLLEAAGVDTVPELAQRNPDNLFQALVNTNQEKHLVRQLPTQTQVAEWVEQAKQLPRIIQY